MAGISIEGVGLGGVLRLTWVSDHLVHVLSTAGPTSLADTWSDLPCPDHGMTAWWRPGAGGQFRGWQSEICGLPYVSIRFPV